MIKNIIRVFIFISFFIILPVSASNDVDYKLTITKDYDFKEEINYSLTNYKTIEGGSTYFDQIVNDDIYTDVEYKIKYQKKKNRNNGKYYVTLSNTYSEYGLGNANFLHNCFESESYDYDIDKISFNGSGGFNCMNGDSLKITIITDFEVTSHNADNVLGNKYIWNVKDTNFAMNISLNKTYEQKSNANEYDDDIVIDDTEVEDETSNNDESNTQTTSKSKTSPIVIALIIGIAFIFILITILVLKAKANKNNSL